MKWIGIACSLICGCTAPLSIGGGFPDSTDARANEDGSVDSGAMDAGAMDAGGEDLCAGVICPSDDCNDPGTCEPRTGQCSPQIRRVDDTRCGGGGICRAGVCKTLSNVFAASTGASVSATDHWLAGFEPGLIDGKIDETGAAFAADGSVGTLSSADITTNTVVTARSFRMVAAHDGPPWPYRRTLSHMKLEADVDGRGSFATVLVDRDVNFHYDSEPDNVSSISGTLDLTMAFPETTARKWRVTVTQANEWPMFDGPRVVEVELTGYFH